MAAICVRLSGPKDHKKQSSGVTHRRFYEAEFVKTRCENSLCFIFCSFLPTSDNNSHLFGFGA
jgi:hypothetical protein